MSNLYRFLLAGPLGILLFTAAAMGQAKYEREYSIKKARVPAEALKFVEDVFNNPKVRWYGEEGLNRSTIEAKLKHSGKSYSIEFSTSGHLEDIEVITPFAQLPKEVRTAIQKNLADTFSGFRITKTQTQLIGTSAKLKAAVQNDELPEDVEVNYELIVKGKKTKMTTYFEVLCTDKGVIKTVRELVQRNSDNLIY